MLRAVLDVNVLVSALFVRQGAPAAVVDAWCGGRFELIASPALLAEFDGVLARPQHAARVGFAGPALGALIRADAIVVDDAPGTGFVPGDPRDDYLITLARAAGAHAIVTGDRHLLDLDGLTPPVLEPRAFLALVDRLT